VKLKHAVATALVVIVVIWMVIPRERNLDDGYSLPDNDAPITAASGDRQPGDSSQFIVRVAHLEARSFGEQVRVRGQTKAFRLVDVRAETSGRVVATPVERGARVNEGDLLCELAVDNRAVDLQEARSRMDEAQLEYDGAVDLQDRGLQSRVGLARLKATLDASVAAYNRAELALQRIRITAPFAGIMESRSIEVGDLLDMGGTCAALLDDTPMLVVGLVPEQNVGKLYQGAPVSVRLLNGETVDGSLTYISRAADPQSRSYAIEVELAPTDSPIRQGITAELYIAGADTMAHLIPSSSLTLDDQGRVGVKILDDANVVQFFPVTIVGENIASNPGSWVTGLPARATVITHGQEIVFPGQTVRSDDSWSQSQHSSN